MRTRLVRRPLLAGLLLAVAVGGLTACRTDPNVAAYVGDSRITTAELDAAVDQRLENDAIAQFAQDDEAGFSRRVLGFLVAEEIYAAAGDRFGVEVDDADVRARLDQLLAGQDPNVALDQAAQQGFSRDDVLESLRQQLLRQRIAEAEGKSEGITEQALRDRYEQDKQNYARFQLGLITVPDEATANAVVAQLDANPRSYTQLAAQFAGQNTLPAPQDITADRLVPELQAAVAQARPNTAFTTSVPNVSGVVVGLVGPTQFQSFEDVRDDVETTLRQEADQAGTKLVDQVRDDLDVTVNPAYGVLDGDTIKRAEGGVVKILDDQGSGGSSSSGN